MRTLRILPLAALLSCSSILLPEDRESQRLASQKPEYPSDLQEQGIEGYVLVSYTIDAEGTVRQPAVAVSVPGGVFDALALSAVSQWRFSPRRIAGENVSRQAESIVTFCLPNPATSTSRPEPCRGTEAKASFIERMKQRE